MDDHQLLFELEVLINAEKLRPLEDDPRDSYAQIETIKNLQAIYDRFSELSKAEYDRKLKARLEEVKNK